MFQYQTSTLECMPYGDRFKEGLARPGRSRAGVAKAMGVSQQAVYAIVAGKTKSATAENNAAAAAYFGCDPTWLASGKGRPNWNSTAPFQSIEEPPAPPANFADRQSATDSDWALLDALKWFPQDEREALIKDVTTKAEKLRAYVAEHLDKVNGKAKGEIDREDK